MSKQRPPETAPYPADTKSFVMTAKAKYEAAQMATTSNNTDNKQRKQETKQKRKRLRNLYDDFLYELKQWKKGFKKMPVPVFDTKPEEIDRTEKTLQSLNELCKKFMGRFNDEFRQNTLMDSSLRTCPPQEIVDSVTQDVPQQVIESPPATSTEGETLSDTKLTTSRQSDKNDRENARYIQKLEGLQKENDELKKALETKKVEIEKTMRDTIAKMKDDLSNKDRRISELTRNISTLKMEKEEALTRLSEIAGRKLHDDNANIADLSTDIRPTKISEKFRECYDNEWTDAFEELTDGVYTEEKAILHMLKILKKTYEFSQTYSEKFETMIEKGIARFPVGEKEREEAGRINVPKDGKSIVKDLKKATVACVVENLQKKFVGDINKALDRTLGNYTELFTKKCVELTWYMIIQTPPMEISYDLEEGSEVNLDLFAYYTSQGKYVDFPVWPCVRLHKGGPLLSKGIVQGRKTKHKETSDIQKEDIKDTKQDSRPLRTPPPQNLPVPPDDGKTESISSLKTNRRETPNQDIKSRTTIVKNATGGQNDTAPDVDRKTRTFHSATTQKRHDSSGDKKAKTSTVISVTAPSADTRNANIEGNEEGQCDQPNIKTQQREIHSQREESKETRDRQNVTQNSEIQSNVPKKGPFPFSTTQESKTRNGENSRGNCSQGLPGSREESAKPPVPERTKYNIGKKSARSMGDIAEKKKSPAPKAPESKPNQSVPIDARGMKSHGTTINVTTAPLRGEQYLSKTIGPCGDHNRKKTYTSWTGPKEV